MARQLGISDDILERLDELESCPLDERDRSALRFAEKMTLEFTAITGGDLDSLREHFDEDQIVEIACVIGIFNYLNRFAEAMGLWPTRPGEGGPEDSG